LLITENRKLRKAHQNVSNEIIQLMNIDLLRSKGDWEIKINQIKRMVENETKNKPP
jgi:hypothetical protein